MDVVGVIAGSGQQGLTGLNVTATPTITNVDITNVYWSTLSTSVLLADSLSEYVVINGTTFSPGTAIQMVSNSSAKNALDVSYNGPSQLAPAWVTQSDLGNVSWNTPFPCKWRPSNPIQAGK